MRIYVGELSRELKRKRYYEGFPRAQSSTNIDSRVRSGCVDYTYLTKPNHTDCSCCNR